MARTSLFSVCMGALISWRRAAEACRVPHISILGMNILDAPRDVEYLEDVAYSSEVERLSRIAFPSAATERNMAYYSAYFDESTSADSPVLVVAGFLSTDAQWMLFEREWKEVLAAFEITAFHAQHFSKHKEEFLGWEEPKRKALLRKLLSIINERAAFGFASTVHVKEFDAVFTGNDRRDIGSPYNLCCTACYLQIGHWAQRNYQVEPLALIFDAGHKNAGDVTNTFNAEIKKSENIAYRLGSLTFSDDKVMVPLQAADLAAYELWKWLDEHFAQKKRHGRFPLLKMMNTPWSIRAFDRPILEEILQHRKTGKADKKTVLTFIPMLKPGETDK